MSFAFHRAAAVLALSLALSTTASAQTPAATPTPNAPRLRALDFSPFDAALAGFTDTRAAAVGSVASVGNVLDVQAALRAGSFKAEDLLLHFVQRVRRHDDRLRSLLELNPRALDEARASDARRAAGRPIGPLDGIPVTLKDNIETAGPMHTTAGAELMLDRVAPQDAPLVAQLRAAGAVILGKANLSEFAGVITDRPLGGGGSSAVGGQAGNPHGVPLTGGSSAGSAVGTAAGLTMLSVGTETSGSLLAPAGWASLVAMKPSRGVVDGRGIVPLLRNNDSAGPVARSVLDAALLLDVIDSRNTDYLAALKADALDGVTVGVLGSAVLTLPGNAQPLQIAATTLAIAGARLRPAELVNTPDWANPLNFLRLLATGIRLDMMGYVGTLGLPVTTVEELMAYNEAQPQRRIPFGQQQLKNVLSVSGATGPADFAAQARSLTQQAAAILDAAFARTGAQLLLSLDNQHSAYYATAGYPAVTVPLGLRVRSGGIPVQMGVTVPGVPVGATLIGKPGDDARLLGFAYAFEQASRLRVVPNLP